MLGCGCWKEYPTPVVVGEQVFCRKHGAAVVKTFGVENWNITCQSCSRYNRYNLGAAPLTARTKGTTHALKNRHTVRIYTDDGIEEIINPDARQLELVEDPPF